MTEITSDKNVHQVIRINSLTRALNNYTSLDDMADRITDWLDDYLDDDDDFSFDVEVGSSEYPVAFYDEDEDSFILSLPDTNERIGEFVIAKTIVTDLNDFLIPETGSFSHFVLSFKDFRDSMGLPKPTLGASRFEV